MRKQARRESARAWVASGAAVSVEPSRGPVIARLEHRSIGDDRVLAVVDEAQSVPYELLEEIRLLTNAEDGRPSLYANQAIAIVAPDLFRSIYAFALGQYEEDRASYHVSASLVRAAVFAKMPAGELATALESAEPSSTPSPVTRSRCRSLMTATLPEPAARHTGD